MEHRIIYYKDELKDDFANDKKIQVVRVDQNYKYIHKNIFWKTTAFIVHRILFLIPMYLFAKIKFRLQIVGREKLTQDKSGKFIYHNHTQEVLDAILPTFISFPKKNYVITNAKNISINGLKTANKMMGALPIPEDKTGTKNFLKAIEFYINKKKNISIYPEAHIWPYYTKIRNFKSVSFKYPIMLNTPTYCATTTYKKRKNGKVKIIVYVDGPFLPDANINKKEAEIKLRNEVYETMVKRAKQSNIEIIKYIKLGE